MKKAIVIGGGISGLATAALLQKDGFEVELFEKNDQLGGRARQFSEKGFVFDMGPSWYMMPEVFEKFFEVFGHKPGDFYELKKLPVHYRVFFSPEDIYDVSSDINKNIDLFEKISPGSGERLKKYLEKTKYLYEQSMKNFVLEDYKSLKNLLKWKNLGLFAKMKLFSNFDSFVSSYFPNKKLQKILEFITVFLGGSPYNTPAFYSLLSYADYGLGLSHPLGGIHKIVEAMEKVCLDQGVKIYTEANVEKIITKQNKAVGVIVNGNEIRADAVVCSADYSFAETKLLEKEVQTYPEKYWQTKTFSPSAFLVYLGINKKLDKLSHHNLYLDESWEKHFEETFKNPAWPKSPSYYVHVPSRTDASLVPPGGETIIVLVPIAPGLPDNPQIREEYAKKTIKHLEKIAGEPIEDSIEVQKIFTIKDFETSYNAAKGTAFGLAHTLMQSAIFRPKNFSKKIKNLYYTGQYANPGIGMPTVVLSAMITANLIKKEN